MSNEVVISVHGSRNCQRIVHERLRTHAMTASAVFILATSTARAHFHFYVSTSLDLSEAPGRRRPFRTRTGAVKPVGLISLGFCGWCFLYFHSGTPFAFVCCPMAPSALTPVFQFWWSLGLSLPVIHDDENEPSRQTPILYVHFVYRAPRRPRVNVGRKRRSASHWRSVQRRRKKEEVKTSGRDGVTKKKGTKEGRRKRKRKRKRRGTK